MEAPPDLVTEVSDLYNQVLEGQVIHDLETVSSAMFQLLGHFGLSIYKFEHKADSVQTVKISHKSKS